MGTPLPMPLSQKVCDTLRILGWRFGLSIGVVEEEPISAVSIGIFRFTPVIPAKRYLFGLLERPERYAFVGVIWFGQLYGATPDHWVIEVHGQENLAVIEMLARQLRRAHAVNITTVVSTTKVRLSMPLPPCIV